MFPDFAENLVQAYEDFPEAVAIGGVDVAELPPVAQALIGSAGERKKVGYNRASQVRPWKQWVKHHVLFHSDSVFIRYDRNRSSPELKLDDRVGYQTDNLTGFAMSARREVALSEPFNNALLAYCPMEDADATYRFGRHGAVFVLKGARVHHFEAAASRIARKAVVSLQVSNMALFIHQNGSHKQPEFWIYVARRLLGETIKDVGSRRWSLPQVRGVLSAIPRSAAIFRRHPAEVGAWYGGAQRKVLGWQ
jgi:hypothetical protein